MKVRAAYHSLRLFPLLCACFAVALLVSDSAAELEKLGGEMQVNTYTSNYQRTRGKAQVGVADDGDFVVTWQSYYQDGSATSVAARRFSADGTPKADDFVVNTTTLYLQEQSSLAMQPDGSFAVVWTNDDYSSGSVEAQRYDSSGGATGAEFQIDTSMQLFPAYPSAAPLPGGGFVVAWDGIQSGLLPDVFARIVSSAGAPVGAQIPVGTDLDADRKPFVASNASGEFIVLYNGDGVANGSSGVAARRYDVTGTPIGTQFIVHTTNAGEQRDGAALLRDDGSAVFVWTSENIDGDLFGIGGRRFGTDGLPVGTEFVVNAYTSDNQEYPSIASLPGDRFVVVWDSQNVDGDIGTVVVREFGGDAVALGDEMVVNTYTSNTQGRSAVASAPDGSFVVTWTSYFQNGYYSDVFAQRMRRIPEGSTTTTTLGGPTTTTTTTSVTTTSSTTTTLPGGTMCAQPVSTGPNPLATDCLFILRAAVGLATCSPECICAPKGSLPTTATDALVCLNVAVGTPGVVLSCPCV